MKKDNQSLVGTVSIEKSEKLSNILKREGIKHEVLNAKYHEKEAEIIAQAGKLWSSNYCNKHGRTWYRYYAWR